MADNREADLYIQNNTSVTLTLVANSLHQEHGKLKKDLPETIGTGGGSIEVINKTGALEGPKGSVKYSFGTNDGNVTFSWNHPFNASTSAYTAILDTQAQSFYVVNGPETHNHPDHRQTVNISIDNRKDI